MLIRNVFSISRRNICGLTMLQAYLILGGTTYPYARFISSMISIKLSCIERILRWKRGISSSIVI